MIDIFPTDVTEQVIKFRNFLNAGWPSLNNLMENHNWDDDGSFTLEWVQVNWEFLVERELLEGNGFLTRLNFSKRITFPLEKPTHKLVYSFKEKINLEDWIRKKQNYEGEELFLSGFCTKRDISYGFYPPFDYAELCTFGRKKIYIVPVDNCRFILDRMEQMSEPTQYLR